MKLITIRINNRINKILNFSNERWSSNNTFIIRGKNLDGTRELFSIKQDTDLIDGKERRDVHVQDIQIDGNTVRVFLETGKWKKIDCDNFTFDSQRKEYVFKMMKPMYGDCIEVEFHLDGSDNHFSIFMYFAPKVYDAIVDFGSEASQACWYKNGRKKDVHITEGIHTILKSIENPDTQNIAKKKKSQDKSKVNQDEIKGYVQYETDNLYKSVYYMKRDLRKIELKPWPDYTSDAIKFLVPKSEEMRKILAEHFQLPNAKLSYFDITKYNHTTLLYNEGEEPITLWQLPDGIIERILLNNIVMHTLRSIQSDPEAEQKGAYVVLNVLMPNVYPIHVVSEKLNQLAEDINALLKGQAYKDGVNNVKFDHIKAVELCSVSESDASLLGYANNSIIDNKAALTPGIYLIMDAGKGTLDFSLMEVNQNEGYVNKSKAGIIGAGNAITYGLIVGLVNDYLSEELEDYPDNPKEQSDLIREFIYEKILGKNIDVATLQAFHKAVEQYKKVYNQLYLTSTKEKQSTSETVPAVETSSDGSLPNSEMEPADQTARNGATGSNKVNLEDFNKWVESMCKSNTKLSEAGCKYVTIEIKNIAAEAIEKMGGIFDCIQKSKIKGQKYTVDTIVFTGRGFLMKEFQDVMLDYLKTANIVNKGAVAITPLPDLMKTGCLNINQKLIGGKYDASPSRQTIGLLRNISNNQGNEQNNPESGQGIIEENPDRTNQIHLQGHHMAGQQVVESIEGNIEDGIEIKGITGESSLSVGGWLYGIDNRFGNHDCTVFFDGNEYIITAEGVESQELGGEMLQTTQNPPLCFESLFPNVSIDKKEDVIIPEERQKPILVQPVRRESDKVVKTKKDVKQKKWYKRFCQRVRILCKKWF